MPAKKTSKKPRAKKSVKRLRNADGTPKVRGPGRPPALEARKVPVNFKADPRYKALFEERAAQMGVTSAHLGRLALNYVVKDPYSPITTEELLQLIQRHRAILAKTPSVPKSQVKPEYGGRGRPPVTHLKVNMHLALDPRYKKLLDARAEAMDKFTTDLIHLAFNFVVKDPFDPVEHEELAQLLKRFPAH